GVCASFFCVSHRARLNRLYTFVAGQKTRPRLCICPTRVYASSVGIVLATRTTTTRHVFAAHRIFRGTELMYNSKTHPAYRRTRPANSHHHLCAVSFFVFDIRIY
ncbi:unnamed protein product, partial [Ectocarpus sp. 4 AP-2014]